MKKLSLLLLVLLLASFLLTGCTKAPVSHYNAVGYVRSYDSASASMSFMSFNGTQVFTLKSENDRSAIKYSGKLEEGELTVSYEYDGMINHLCTLSAGEEISDTFAVLGKGKIYVIIETSEECKNGSLDFELFYL